nr:uncharacterized protein KIAA0930 homolog isoform X3 [Ipomoea batatas]
MVKKHSKFLGKTIVEEEDSSDVEMDPEFWHELDDLLGENSVGVDWRRSYYLNLIAHTTFSVTVAICSHEVLKTYQTGKDKPLSPIYKVVKTVYASPSRINFHLDSRKASVANVDPSMYSRKTDRIYMKGPGGRGEVEVAVSGVVDQSKEEYSHHSPKKGLSFSAVVRRAASVASVAAKHAYAAASATRSSDEEMIPLKCCLMSISLPWSTSLMIFSLRRVAGREKAETADTEPGISEEVEIEEENAIGEAERAIEGARRREPGIEEAAVRGCAPVSTPPNRDEPAFVGGRYPQTTTRHFVPPPLARPPPSTPALYIVCST